MESPSDPVILHHDAAGQRFEWPIGPKAAPQIAPQTAYVEYRPTPQGLALTHTYVPPALNGQGIGGRLVAAVLAQARHEGIKVIPQCPFVARYVERHPDYADVIAAP